MPLPSVTFAPTDMVAGRNSIITLTIAASPTHFIGKLLDFQGNLAIARQQAPGAANGPAYTAKTWESERSEFLRFEMREMGKLITLLGSLTGKKDGTCTAYVRDPGDAANTVALKSDDFPCSIYAEGDVRFDNTGTAVRTIVIESLKDGAIAWSKNASTA